jgi:ribosomal protein L29
MTFKELAAKTETELRKDLDMLRTEAHELAVKIRLGQVKNYHELRTKKKAIAQIHTLLTNKH